MARALMLLLIRAYQRGMPASARGHCRFTPSCSEYARQAIAKHGAITGCSLALRRVLRCHPLGTHGYDPVP